MTTNNHINELLNQIKSNNKLAFNTIYTKYYKIICSYSFSIVGNYEAVKDIVQEVFIKIWEHRHKLPVAEKFEAYLYSTTKNKSLDYIKSISIKDKHKALLLKITNEEHDEQVNHEIKELNNLIVEKITSLSPACRNVYEHKMLGLTNKQIAKKLNITVKTIEWHVTTAKKAIKEVAFKYLH
jgi:RNA polymerase sigma-70 factor (ECF subfamily)